MAIIQPDQLAKLLQRHNAVAPGRPPVVVASVFQTGLNLMRDLDQKGLFAIGIDCEPGNPGFQSKYGVSLLCPNPDKAPQDWLKFMIALSNTIGEKPVLIAAADIFVAAIGQNAGSLRDHFIFSEQGCILQASLATKDKQYALAREAGLPSPRSAYVESADEIRAFASDARFPVLLKPRSHREWSALPFDHPLQRVKTISSKTPEELIANYESVQDLVPQAVVQEEIVGPDSSKYCYLSVYAQNGRRLGACVVRELRAYPLQYGCATLVEPVIDEEIDCVCNQFLLSLGYVGLCEIELKRDARDGRLLLIEVNPRFSGTGDCARYTGVEVGYLHYLDLIGQTPQPVAPSNFNFRHIMLVADLTAFPIQLGLGLITWRAWFKSLEGQLEYYDLDLADVRNARRTFYKGTRAFLGGLLRGWGLRR